MRQIGKLVVSPDITIRRWIGSGGAEWFSVDSAKVRKIFAVDDAWLMLMYARRMLDWAMVDTP